MAIVHLALGSNLGDRESALRLALELLSAQVVVRRVSSIYETAPVGPVAQGDFLNAVLEGETALSPTALLALAKRVERQVGRMDSAVRWGPRIVDVDILSYDDLMMLDPQLELPHPRLAERAFVLVPLAEIAPHWRHPTTGRSAVELLAALGEVTGVKQHKAVWWPR